jgi:hypothetical protein
LVHGRFPASVERSTIMLAFLRRTYLLWTALAAIILGYLVPLFLWRAFRNDSGE